MKTSSFKSAGYLLSLIPQILLVCGVYSGHPWLSFVFFFFLLPVVRRFTGNDRSEQLTNPSRLVTAYLCGIPRLYCALWVMVLPWTIWVLATKSMDFSEYLGFTLSFWIVVSLNIAIAHELIHSHTGFDRSLGRLLVSSVGYFHFPEEHATHHARNGHFHGGDSSPPETSIYAFALKRYRLSQQVAWEAEHKRLKRSGKNWLSNRLIRSSLIPLAVAGTYFHFAGATGLAIYLFQIFGAAFTLQAITFLQHWGLSEMETPELADYGFTWEDGCWMQACVTLNHAYHAQHHLNSTLAYYELTPLRNGLQLPASYPVMFLVALAPPLLRKSMHRALSEWRERYYRHEVEEHGSDCIGVSRVARLLRNSQVDATGSENKT